MIVRALDVEGDWTFGKGRNDYKQRVEAVVQTVGTRLKSFLGDCFFASDAGIDWFNLLGSKNQIALELAIRATILNTPNVASVVSSSATLDATTRSLLVTYVITTIFSNEIDTTPISGTSTFLLTEDGDVLTTESGSGLQTG